MYTSAIVQQVLHEIPFFSYKYELNVLKQLLILSGHGARCIVGECCAFAEGAHCRRTQQVREAAKQKVCL